MKENYTYNQYKKKNVRHSAIYNAVELLTSKRESAACVERNYVRRLYDYFTLSEDISQNREEAEKIEVSYITNWEKLHDAYVSKGQILRSTPNTAPLICGAYNTQPEGLSTMA